MIFETEVFVRDTVRMNILQEVMAGSIVLAVQKNDDVAEDYAAQVHNDMSRVRVYGNFNLSESVDGQILTIRPISVSGELCIAPTMAGEIQGKTISLVRSATKKEDGYYPLDKTVTALKLVPANDRYILQVEYADSASQEPSDRIEEIQPVMGDMSPVEEVTAVMEEMPAFTEEIPPVVSEVQTVTEEMPPVMSEMPTVTEEIPPVVSEVPTVTEEILPVVSEVPTVTEEIPPVMSEVPTVTEEISPAVTEVPTATEEISPNFPTDEKVRQIQEEIQKDYDSAKTDMEEYQKRLTIDSGILEYYRDRDVKPIETLLQEIAQKLDEAEKQISMFIQEKQRKTMEIEGSIKSNQ